MADIQPKTWTRMKWAWSVAFICFAFLCVKGAIDVPATLPMQVALLLAAPMLLACFPLLAELNRNAADRRANQLRWLRERRQPR